MYHVSLITFLLVATSLAGLIVLQQGKDGNMGVSFGTVPKGGLFRSRNSNNAMTRIIAMLATLFFVLSLLLGNLSGSHRKKSSQWDNLYQSKQQEKIPIQQNQMKSDNEIPQ